MKPRGGSPQERFWKKVNKSGPVPASRPELGPCWIWTACKSNGYGHFSVDGIILRAHRVSYRELVGEIEAGLELDHLCRTRACVRPSHLEPVTGTVNILRGESIQAKNARKTHCIRGHAEWGNDKRGRRYCKVCYREADRRYYALEKS
jgi:hypothetical protein